MEGARSRATFVTINAFGPSLVYGSDVGTPPGREREAEQMNAVNRGTLVPKLLPLLDPNCSASHAAAVT
jgi:hypothetical protein